MVRVLTHFRVSSGSGLVCVIQSAMVYTFVSLQTVRNGFGRGRRNQVLRLSLLLQAKKNLRAV